MLTPWRRSAAPVAESISWRPRTSARRAPPLGPTSTSSQPSRPSSSSSASRRSTRQYDTQSPRLQNFLGSPAAARSRQSPPPPPAAAEKPNDAHAGAAASHARLHCESDASSAEPSADGGYATAALSAHTALPAPALAYTCVTLSRGRQ